MKYKVVIADDRYSHYNEETELLDSIGASIVNERSSAKEDIARAASDADGLIVNLPIIDSELIASLQKCKIISRYGVGYDNVDIKSATERGIWVANVPDYCAEDVSDQALALLMSCVRKVALRDRHVRAGIWDVMKAGAQYRLAGKVFGFFGYGRIAQALHRKISGFKLDRVLVFDPYVAESDINASGAEKADAEEILSSADFLSIHMPLNEETRGFFNKSRFKRMKPTAILVNTSRGGLIDEADLFKALSEGWINSAGLDVFEREPIDPNNPLLTLDNITVSGHTGWYTEESQTELKRKAAQNVYEVLLGNRPAYPVNKIQ